MSLINAVRDAVARGWTHPRNTEKAVDPHLSEAIVDEIMKELSTSEPSLEDAKNLLVSNDLQAVAIVSVMQDGTINVSTYGSTKFNCAVIGDWGQGLLGRGLSVVPFQTAFGWGNNGIPHAVSPSQLEAASPEAQEYVTHNTHEHALSFADDELLRTIQGLDLPKHDWTYDEMSGIERLKLWGLIVEEPGALRPYAITKKGSEYVRRA